MAFTHVKDRLSPSISDTIRVDGVAFDLTGSSVKFRMRAEGSATLKVDATATIVTPAAGSVRYDWIAGNVDTAGDFLGWWNVTLPSTKQQDTLEFVIRIVEHAPVSTSYVESDDLKETLRLEGLRFADADIADTIASASRKVEEICGRRFWADVDAAQVRKYTPGYADRIWIDDLVTLTSLKTDANADGTYEQTWTSADYILEPLNAVANGRPWESIRAAANGAFRFPGYVASVELTGKFGWSTVPQPIRTATKLIAHRYLKRLRESPHGVVGFGLDGAVVRMMSIDPDVEAILGDYSRKVFVR
jgi:hypothetical protein